jgi:DNA mismatch repair protein MutS2
LHISAFDNSELAVFEEIFADIGDEQSIEQSLSTFSSHMSNIVRILDNVTNNSLVLLDELGAGTDPTEGAALAIAIIKYLHALGVRTAVTTHYSELKVFALTADGVENASCEFDVETLRPTYRLLIGVPGKSNAFAISQRLGLPEYIINEAKEVLSHEDVRFEDVITELEISKKNVAVEQERAEQYRQEAQRLKAEAEKQKQKLDRQREKIVREAQEEARRLVSDAKDEADAIIKEIRKLQRDGANIEKVDKKRKQLGEKLKGMEVSTPQSSAAHTVPKTLKTGDRVYIHSLAQSGVVMSPPDSSRNVMIKTGIMKVKIGIEDLSLDTTEPEKPAKQQKAKKQASGFRNSKAKDVSPQVDLRGMMALEAIDKLDKYLDDAYLAGLNQVTIIHGKGTGALRSAVQDYLRTHGGVKSYRQGIYGEGEAGVTIAELK